MVYPIVSGAPSQRTIAHAASQGTARRWFCRAAADTDPLRRSGSTSLLAWFARQAEQPEVSLAGELLNRAASDVPDLRDPLLPCHNQKLAPLLSELFERREALREIHVELEGLNAEAAELAARISRNFKELRI